jgi:hypothetical protein
MFLTSTAAMVLFAGTFEKLVLAHPLFTTFAACAMLKGMPQEHKEPSIVVVGKFSELGSDFSCVHTGAKNG